MRLKITVTQNYSAERSMEVERQHDRGLAKPKEGGDASSLTAGVRRRSRAGSASRNSSSSLSEIFLEEDESGQASLLNFAVMENACLVTRKRRSRTSCVELAESNVSVEKGTSDNLENLKTSSDNFIAMEKASMAIRRRRVRSENFEDQKTF